jgi:hypothetical protein
VAPRSLAFAFGVPAALCAAWTLVAGKDLNWDLLNYHYYLPYELLAGRLQQDFFAASAQSYLNPVAYVPFYLMVHAGWHSVIVSLVLAALHSVSLALLYLLSFRLFAHLPERERFVFSLLSTAMGAATWVFWPTVGTSFLDPLLSPLVLGAVWLLLDRPPVGATRAVLAGALLGAAAALKYSFAIYGVAALPLLLAGRPRSWSAAAQTTFAYVAGGLAAFAALAGPWCVLLTREFGNPVFPLMNAWFRSPDAPAVNLVAARFTPQDLASALAFPFRLIALDRSLYSEIFAPDLRLAALVVGVTALVALWLAKRLEARSVLRAADWRLLGFFGIAYLLWIATSANGRYGLVVLLLAGVCLVRVAERLLPPGAARVVLLLLLVVQVATSLIAAPTRWFIAEAWSRRWLAFSVPERAQRKPALYLTVESLPMAVVAPFLDPRSSFVNFRGLHSVAPDSPRLVALLAEHQGSIRALGRGVQLGDGQADEALAAYDTTFMRIGYRVDRSDCLTIAWQPQAGDALSRAANLLALPQPAHEPLSLVSCALQPAARDAKEERRERAISIVFDRVESGCPRLFRGQTAVTEPLGAGWSRHYAGLDARLEALGGRLILRRYRAAVFIDLGTVAAWQGSAIPDLPGCERR